MKAVAALLLSVLGILQYQLWSGDGGVADLQRLREAVESQRAENAALAERNQILDAEVLDLKQGVDTVEGIARMDLGMTHRDETFFQYIEE